LRKHLGGAIHLPAWQPVDTLIH